MKPGQRPLVSKDFLVQGRAVDGYIDIRIVDGDKLASKRLLPTEAVALKQWLTNFLKEYNLRNRHAANIEQIDEMQRMKFNKKPKMTFEDIEHARSRYENGEPVKKLADEFGVTEISMYRMLNG